MASAGKNLTAFAPARTARVHLGRGARAGHDDPAERAAELDHVRARRRRHDELRPHVDHPLRVLPGPDRPRADKHVGVRSPEHADRLEPRLRPESDLGGIETAGDERFEQGRGLVDRAKLDDGDNPKRADPVEDIH
jgi:hypothetical protein